MVEIIENIASVIIVLAAVFVLPLFIKQGNYDAAMWVFISICLCLAIIFIKVRYALKRRGGNG